MWELLSTFSKRPIDKIFLTSKKNDLSVMTVIIQNRFSDFCYFYYLNKLAWSHNFKKKVIQKIWKKNSLLISMNTVKTTLVLNFTNLLQFSIDYYLYILNSYFVWHKRMLCQCCTETRFNYNNVVMNSLTDDRYTQTEQNNNIMVNQSISISFLLLPIDVSLCWVMFYCTKVLDKADSNDSFT